MIIKLFDFESFSEEVGYVLFFVDLLKLHVISIHDLSYKVMAM